MHFENNNFINGKSYKSNTPNSINIINPATEETIAQIKESNEEDVKEAVSAAKVAYKEWKNTSPLERSSILMQIADIVKLNIDDLAHIESINVGKPLDYVKDEVMAFADSLTFFAGASRNLSALNTGEYVENRTSMIRREPIGVVGSITPWNYPLMMAGWKIGPALAAGNTVVLKPSELTPLTTLKVVELTKDILPPGVLNVVTGYGDTVGEALTSHPEVDMISLTGSVRAGQAVIKNSVNSLKKLHLELGGKAPVVIFDDADINHAVEGVIIGAFYNSGQDCTAATRLYIEDTIFDRFISELKDRMKRIKIGDPMEEGTELGPLISKEHLNRVKGFVDKALTKEGVERFEGGTSNRDLGHYYPPTLITGVKQSDEIVQEEVFGPVITAIPFVNEENAIELANDSKYALASSVWTKDLKKAMNMIKRLEYGTVWVNDHLTLISEMPHGGFKMSGYGRDQSTYSIEEYTEIKHAMINS